MINIKKGFGKYVWIIGIISILGYFSFLEELGVNTVCHDVVCQSGENASFYCNSTNNNRQSVYIFNHNRWNITFQPDITNYKIFVKYYGKWRFTNFTKATRFSNIPEDKKYVFVYPGKKTKYFKIDFTCPIKPTVIKYSVGTYNTHNITSYKFIYENKSRQVPVYKDVLVIIKSVYVPENNTWTKAYNYTKKEIVNYKTEHYKGNKLRLQIGNKFYSKHSNVKNDKVYTWKYPQGDRNYAEFGECRSFEKYKGVCNETNII